MRGKLRPPTRRPAILKKIKYERSTLSQYGYLLLRQRQKKKKLRGSADTLLEQQTDKKEKR